MSKRSDRRREMEQLLSLREQEGLSLREVAEEFGIPVGTVSWWAHRLRAEKKRAFTEMRVATSPAPAARSDPASLRLRFPGGVVAEFDGELAREVTDALLGEVAR